ncbi:cytochrome P450 [Pseudomassariella vexata]|uniref:Cytochrome P450 n=1 Tax=Pseudomassariella vexata TaxID=1141098 RepID=A0A1Y2EII4_9PEZI|nr:cytochrome P450 [Pseudomassariella vexata]ORY71114.1 cytochrome P450 [Pseudomassariella vexata]
MRISSDTYPLAEEVLLLNSLAAHKAVLQTNCYDFINPPFFARLIRELAGVGVILADGEDHKAKRRLIAGPFSVPSVRKMLPVFQSKAKGLSIAFTAALDGYTQGSIQFMPLITKVTMDIIGVTSLGVEIQELFSSKLNIGLPELYDRLLHQDPLGTLIWIVNSFLPIRRFVPLQANWKFVEAGQELRSLLRRVIKKRIHDMGARDKIAEKSESRDLLTYMIKEAHQIEEETGEWCWTEDDFLELLLNFTLAGHETSANALGWAMYVLATKHDVQARLRAEVQGLLEKHSEPDYDHLHALPYMHNFCREILRLYSPAYMAFRAAEHDIVIEGTFIPKGTTINICPAVENLNPHLWGEDAGVFNPDRWGNLTGDAVSSYAFETFIQGPRICPGKNFAVTEIKAILVELVRKWRFVGIEKNDGRRELLTGGEEEIGRGVRLENPSLTFIPAGGLRVRFEPL